MNLFSIAPLTKVELDQLNYTILLSSCDLLFYYLDGLDTLILCGLLDLMGGFDLQQLHDICGFKSKWCGI